MRRLGCERGTVLATTMILMGLMTMVGLATYAYVDGQTLESGRERVRETSFNVGEGLLGSQVFVLSRGWPGTAGGQYPPSCSNGTTDEKCPDETALASAFGGPDVAKGVTWETRVLDNKLDTPRLPATTDPTQRCNDASTALPSYYDDAAMTASPVVTYDQNADCRMWVRAQASIDGRHRTFVGLVRVEQVTEQLPKHVLTAGWFETNNSGNKILIDTQGSAAQAAPVAVRCSTYGNDCADYQADKNQVSPDTVSYDYPSQVLTAEALDRLRERAKSAGTYYATGCPPSLTGAMIFVEGADCAYESNNVYNSAAVPGVLVFARGTFRFKEVFYGAILHANLQNSSGVVVDLQGNAEVHGSIAVDGPGGVTVGADKKNLIYDPNALNRVVSYGNAGIIQNTWREIVPAA